MFPCENGSADGYSRDRVDLLSHLSRRELGAADSILLNDVRGWTDPRTGGEYALVGRMDGAAFVDVLMSSRTGGLFVVRPR